MSGPLELIGTAINFVLQILQYAIFINVLMSWIPQARGSKFDLMLRQFTDPILAPVRAMMSKALGQKGMMIDFSPLIAIILIQVLEGIVKSLFIHS